MPALATSPTATTTTTHEIKLKPKVRRELLTELRTYQTLKAQRDELDRRLKGHRDLIDAIRDETGESSLMLEGFKVTQVAPVRHVLDEKRLIMQGVTTEQIEKATIDVQTKPYVKISCPGGGDE